MMNLKLLWGRLNSYQYFSRMAYSLIAAPATLWLIIFLCLPLVFVIMMSCGWKLSEAFFPLHFDSSSWLKAMQIPFRNIYWLSLLITGSATFLCLLVSLPVCILLSQLPPQHARKLLALVMIPFLINFLVRVYGWFVLLRADGFLASLFRILGYNQSLLSSWQGVLLGLVYGYLPFMILPIWSSLERIDHHLVEAAQDLGASVSTIWLRIILPQALPGIGAGCLLVAIPMMGEYSIPKMLGGGLVPTIGLVIEGQFLGGVHPDWSLGSAISCILLLGLSVLLWLTRKSILTACSQSIGFRARGKLSSSPNG